MIKIIILIIIYFIINNAAQSHSSKTIMLNNIYERLSLTLVRANARAFNARVATTMDLLEG